MRSGSENPVSRATASIDRSPPSIGARAASTHGSSMARAGDCPVSMRKVRLNWRGMAMSAGGAVIRQLMRAVPDNAQFG